MNSTILMTIISLSLLGLLSAVILYMVAQNKVFEAGLTSHRGFTCGQLRDADLPDAVISLRRQESTDFTGLNRPVGGNEVMAKAASILGRGS
ncbi:MAG: hypothetical protein U0X39_12760 [Bacteroidales bacterium]